MTKHPVILATQEAKMKGSFEPTQDNSNSANHK